MKINATAYMFLLTLKITYFVYMGMIKMCPGEQNRVWNIPSQLLRINHDWGKVTKTKTSDSCSRKLWSQLLNNYLIYKDCAIKQKRCDILMYVFFCFEVQLLGYKWNKHFLNDCYGWFGPFGQTNLWVFKERELLRK